MHPHDIRPIADDGSADQALALRCPVAELQLDLDIAARGVEVGHGLLHPFAQARHTPELPQHHLGRLAGTRAVVASAGDQADEERDEYSFYAHTNSIRRSIILQDFIHFLCRLVERLLGGQGPAQRHIDRVGHQPLDLRDRRMSRPR